MHHPRLVALLAMLLALGSPGVSRAAIPPADPGLPPPQRSVTYGDAVALGVVEGLTEYLPVSSTGHLIVTAHLLGLDTAQPMLDRAGQPIISTHHGETKPLTLKDAVDNYNIIIQGGAILAVLFLYWSRVLSLFRGVLGRDPKGLLVLRNLLLAFIPSAVLGLLTEHWIDAHLFSYKIVAATFALGAPLMLAAERWRKIHSSKAIDAPGPELHEVSWQKSLFIGVCQCASLIPGTSRSMTTIVGGYFTGLHPAQAAEFSFLLGLMTLTAASGYKAVGHFQDLHAAFPAGPLLLGILVATVAAFAAVKWFVRWLTRHGLGAFAWYRLAAAAVILAVM